jgi:hypothetical protein
MMTQIGVERRLFIFSACSEAAGGSDEAAFTPPQELRHVRDVDTASLYLFVFSHMYKHETSETSRR